MREKLKAYVASLFRNAPDTPRNRELQEEILQNTLDRFDDLVSKGCSEDSAYAQAVASIGDVSQLWETAPKPRKHHAAWILGGCVVLAAAVALIVGLTVHFRRPTPAHYEPEPEAASLDEGVGEIVDWAMDLADGAMEKGGLTSSFSYDHAGDYTAGAGELTDNISKLSIHWLSGTVTVEVYDGDTISLSETEQSDPDLQLRWRLDGKELSIQPFASGMHTNVSSKDLLVKLPSRLVSGLRSMTIDTTSADARISGLSLEKLRFDSVSGALYARIDCKSLEADTTSGGLEFSGTVSEVDLDTVSGNFSLTCAETPDELSFDSTSGCITLTIPKERSFRAELDTVSGDLRCAYDAEILNRDT